VDSLCWKGRLRPTSRIFSIAPIASAEMQQMTVSDVRF
jgi:hypothetical protein